MVGVLADPDLYVHTGGAPPDLPTLRDRYARQVAGVSPDGSEEWLNWIIRRRDDGAAVGYVQATVHLDTGVAELAWVVGTPFQRRGYASEAADAVARWLEVRPVVRRLTAHIASANAGSNAVAERLGLSVTDERREGEVVWERRIGGPARIPHSS